MHQNYRPPQALSNLPDNVQWDTIEKLPRETILDFLKKIFSDITRANDYSHRDHPRLSALGVKFESDGACEEIENLLQNLADTKIEIRNLSFFMALMYMDTLGNLNSIYATSNKAVKLFAGCLTVAAKMDPRQEVNREAIANAFELSDRELTEIVEAVLECFPSKRDLNVNTALMKEYIRPLLYSRSAPMLGGVPSSSTNY